MRSRNNIIQLPPHIASEYRGKTIVISGGRGYIGSLLTQSLAIEKCKLILIDQSPGNAWLPLSKNAEILVFHGDISLRETWQSVLPGADYVFHLAAIEYHRSNYDKMRDLEVNALSVLHLIDVCTQNNERPKIIFSSSANIFGCVDTLPVNENYRDNPPSLWSVHKLLAENYLRVYAQKYDMKSVVLRLANVYGPTARPDTNTRVVINKMITNALAGESLTLYSNKNCMRDFIFIDDVVQAFLIAGAENKLRCNGDFYIIGSGEGNTLEDIWRTIVLQVKKITGKDVPLEFSDSVKIEPLDMRQFVADSSCFRNATGWSYQVSLEQGIETTVQCFMS